ncbi:MAG: class II aldolase/adducin family protein [Burkholderiaceae bacterium]|nr:class II aldolase/adducin family protein [Roseateles sp.]MBV8469721.1 class II aldolase/adducin family protein [Burkholderiaceae bacterium]
MQDLHPTQDLDAARQRLQGKGLLLPGDSLSCRLPGTGCFAIVTAGAAGEPVALRELGLQDARAAADEALHGLIYEARDDVGAVLLGRQPWGRALGSCGETLPGVFDEQLRHLGWCVEARALPNDAAQARRSLADGANAYLLSGRALVLGMAPERLVFNAELLEKCAKSYLLARASGARVYLIPWLVRWIATGRLRKDQRRAADHHRRGLAAPRSAGY